MITSSYSKQLLRMPLVIPGGGKRVGFPDTSEKWGRIMSPHAVDWKTAYTMLNYLVLGFYECSTVPRSL